MTGPVIAVSGPPGAGKTSLAGELAARLGARVVAWDEYETMTRLGPEAAADWLKRGAPYEEIEAPGVLEALEEARQHGCVLFDMPLGRAFSQTADLVDFVIWIEVSADIALARKMRQLMPERGTDPNAYLAWLARYLGAYPAVVAPAIQDQRAKVLPSADLKVSSGTSVEAILSQLQSLGVISG